MAIGELTLPTPHEDAQETRLEFPDNRLLIDLFGEFNRNLTQIEAALDVQLVHQGNQLVIFGEPGSQKKAGDVLNALYTRLEAGKEVTPGDIDAEIRMGASARGTGNRPGDQMELFQGGRVEIKTRKKLVEPRTDAQKDYVRALFKNELSFGVGPAGTGKSAPSQAAAKLSAIAIK